MTLKYRTTRRIEFSDTDAAGIAHFSTFFTLMEQTEHEFLRSLGLSVMSSDDEGTISWPRVAANCEFRGAVRFEDVVEIDVTIVRRGERSLTYGFTFSHDGRPIADGEITAVCCRLASGEPPRSIPIPEWVVERLDRPDAEADES
jgi:acyl-CoA thioester hydrolase